MIRLEQLTLAYGARTLLEGVSLTIPDGSLTALIGRNGTGKSTLLRTLAGLQPPKSGSVLLGEERLDRLDAAQLARRVSLVTTERVRIANLCCRDVVALGRAPYTNWIGRMQQADRAVVEASLERVGMASFARKTMDAMSDGECQRVMIARALAQQTPVILLDEPTAFLDLPGRYELGSLLGSLARDEGKCILFSTHELDIARSLCDRVALIDPPHLSCGTPDEVVADGRIERLFSGAAVRFDTATQRILPKK